MRAPGMTWMRIPLFVWTIEAYAVLLILALPTVTAALTLLLLDRQAGTGFFLPRGGRERRCSTSTCSGSSGTPRSTS